MQPREIGPPAAPARLVWLVTDLLSPREREVATLVSEDLADKEIALILCISVRTVHSYLDSIARKIGAQDEKRSRRRVITRWIERNAA
ncbi:MAG: Bacterial regulatory protein luxR family [Gemmatimonadetes bacterium]|nr:Bacterial regulatory protein luxR family [Gemmatimonadota bacterium]